VALVGAFMLLRHTTPWYPLQIIAPCLWRHALAARRRRWWRWQSRWHFALAVAWGLVYCLWPRRSASNKSISGSIILGLLVGAVSQIIDAGLVAPALLPRLHGHDLWAAKRAAPVELDRPANPVVAKQDGRRRSRAVHLTWAIQLHRSGTLAAPQIVAVQARQERRRDRPASMIWLTAPTGGRG